MNLEFMREKSDYDFYEIVEYEDCKDTNAIKTDLNRTFPDNVFFRKGVGQEFQEKVLKCVSLAYPKVGYCQGMNFITGFLGHYLPDDLTFHAWEFLFNNCNLEKFYIDPGNQFMHFYIHEQLMQKYEKKQYEHLQGKGYITNQYCTRWFHLLYCDCLPMSYVSRIWDIFLIEGRKVLFRTAQAILSCLQEKLLECKDLQAIGECIRRAEAFLPLYVSEDEFISKQCSYTFSRKLIDKFEQDYYKSEKLNSN